MRKRILRVVTSDMLGPRLGDVLVATVAVIHKGHGARESLPCVLHVGLHWDQCRACGEHSNAGGRGLLIFLIETLIMGHLERFQCEHWKPRDSLRDDGCYRHTTSYLERKKLECRGRSLNKSQVEMHNPTA